MSRVHPKSVHRPRLAALTLALALPLVGCTWVSLSEGGEQVRVARADDVSGCERLGRTRSTTTHKVGFIPRSHDKVQEELESLARNETASMGGDTVVPGDQSEDGSRTFVVYRCGR